MFQVETVAENANGGAQMFTMVTLGSWQQTKLLQNRRVCSQGLRASDSFLPAVVHHRLQDLTTEQIEQCIA